MRRSAVVALGVVLVLPLALGPVEGKAQDSGAALEHDLENGCGAVGADFVPDNSTVLRAVFGDPTALPELVKWVNDTDSVDYFTESCNAHDRCYGTYGLGYDGKLDCDWAFFTDLAQACAQAYLTPRSPGIWDLATAGILWTSETVWDAVQYTPCVQIGATMMSSAVGLFGWGAFNSAQDHATKAATCSATHPQASFSGLYLPGKGIQRAYEGDCQVVDLGYGDGVWSGTSRDFGNGQEVHWLRNVTEVQTEWNQQIAAGRPLTDLEYGTGNWVAVFTAGTGIGRQFYSTRSEFSDMAKDIRHAWSENLAVTELEYGKGRWVMFASAGTGITNQEWERGITSDAALDATIQSHLDDGWGLTTLEYADDEWVAVFSQGMDWEGHGASSRLSYHDIRVTMDDHAAAGRMALDIEYGNGTWWGVWFVPAQAAPSPTTTTTTAAAKIEVPDVVHLDAADAESAIVSAGLEYVESEQQVDDLSDHYIVQRQSPVAGASVEPGARVRVWVGTYTEPEPVVIATPDVLRQTPTSARTEIQGAGLKYVNGGTVAVTDSNLDGVVADQDPSPGTALLEGDEVTVYFGDYAVELVSVPDVGGLPEMTAVSNIQAAGLAAQMVGAVETTDRSFWGRVIDQDPLPYGAKVQPGTTVRFWIGVQPAVSFPSRKTSQWVTLSLVGSGHATFHDVGETLDFCVSWSQLGGEPPPKWDLISYLTNPAGTYIAGESMILAGDDCPAASVTVTGSTGLKQFGVEIIEYNHSQSQWVLKDTADLWIYVTD